MVDQNLLTIFVALTAVAVVIQTGIVAGLYFVSLKMSRQVDKAITQTHKMMEPVHRLVGAMEKASVQIAEFSNQSQDDIREAEHKLDRTLDRFRRLIA